MTNYYSATYCIPDPSGRQMDEDRAAADRIWATLHEHDPMPPARRTVRAAIVLTTIALPTAIGFELHEDSEAVRPIRHGIYRTAIPFADCPAPTQDILAPPKESMFGITDTGLPLNTAAIDTSHMTSQWYRGSRVGVKQLARIANDGSKLSMSFSDASPAYQDAVEAGLQGDAVRWSLCNLTGGLVLTATDTAVRNNGFYRPADDEVELAFRAGGDDVMYQDERDIAYVVTHESGHELRQKILENQTDMDAIALIHAVDGVYEAYARQAVEMYRTQYGAQEAQNLADLKHKVKSGDSEVLQLDSVERQKIVTALTYVQKQLLQKDGLKGLAVVRDSVPDDPGAAQVRLLDMQGMVERAVQLVVPDSEDYKMSDLTKLVFALITNEDFSADEGSRLSEYVKERMLQDSVLPGNTGGHSQKNSDEFFATTWILTQYVSMDNLGKLLNTLPVSYRRLAEKQFRLVVKLRSTANVQEITQR